MDYLSAVYSVTITPHVSGLRAAPHPAGRLGLCHKRVGVCWKEECLKLLNYLHVIIKCETYSCTICCMHTYIHTLLPPDDGLPASPKHLEV
jgi:hypothetical protein